MPPKHKKPNNNGSLVIPSKPSKFRRRVLFSRKKKGEGKRKKIPFYIYFIIFIVAALAYWLFFSSVFTIQEVEVRGVNSALQEKVIGFYKDGSAERKFIVFSRSNIFVFSDERFKKRLATKFPSIKNISIKKSPPEKILISAEEREQKGVWCNSKEDCFFYDTEGVIYKEAPEVVRGGLLVPVYDNRRNENNLPAKVLQDSTMKYIDELVKYMEEGYKKPFYIKLFEDEVHAGFNDWEVYFSSNGDPVEQVENLALVLRQEIEGRIADLEYIDLRLGNKAFYRYQQDKPKVPVNTTSTTTTQD